MLKPDLAQLSRGTSGLPAELQAAIAANPQAFRAALESRGHAISDVGPQGGSREEAALLSALQAGQIPQSEPHAQMNLADLGANHVVYSTDSTGKFGPQNLQGLQAPQNAQGPMLGALSGTEFISALGAAQNRSNGNSGIRRSDLRVIEGGKPGAPGMGDATGLEALGGFSVPGGEPRVLGKSGRGPGFGQEFGQGGDSAQAGLAPHLAQLGQHGGGGFSVPIPTVEVTGLVTKGSMSQDRLATQSLSGMSTGIRNLTLQGGGEMRVRLKPDNLGELHVRVMTRGNEVGLQIQASNEHAKGILEASMSHLKESMAAQNLSLVRADVSVPQLSQSPSGGFGNEARSELMNQQWQGQSANQGGRQGNQAEWARAEAEYGSRPSAIASAPSMTARVPDHSMLESGRIDVRA